MQKLVPLLALLLAGCQEADQSLLAPKDSPTAPYQAWPVELGGRLVPGGYTMLDTLWGRADSASWDGSAYSSVPEYTYDTLREVRVAVDSLWVDTSWGAVQVVSGDTVGFVAVAIEANRRSKLAGLDTVYQWDRADTSGRGWWEDSLVGFRVRKADGFRVATYAEAHYLLWGGSTGIRPWGSGPISATWAQSHLYGDSATGIRNDLGVYVWRTLKPTDKYHAPRAFGQDGNRVGAFCPPPFDSLAQNQNVMPSRRWATPPTIFVRTKR